MSAIGMSNDLLKFFQARPPLPYIPYPKTKPHKPYEGIADLLNDIPDLFDKTTPIIPEPYIDVKKRREIKRNQKIMLYNQELKNKIDIYKKDNNNNNDKKTKDPYNTLFIARLNYDTTERTLRKELELFGNILSIYMIKDYNNESRGYAFVEYENEESLKLAYNSLNKKIIDGWRILVDVERGRTVENWLPKRLGGGKGIIRGIELNRKNKSNYNYSMSSKYKETNYYKSYNYRNQYDRYHQNNDYSFRSYNRTHYSRSNRYNKGNSYIYTNPY